MSQLVVTTWANGSHHYALRGQATPGVTTLTGQLDKPALLGWYASKAASWAADNPDQLQQLGRDSFIDMAKSAPLRERDSSASIGRNVHEHAERLQHTGEAPDVGGDELRMVLQAAHFLDEMRAETIVSERAVYHETFGYAGRFDAIVSIRDELWLLDWKTGASGVWPEMALQAAAYRFASHMQALDPNDDDVAMVPVAHAGIVWVRPEGWQLVPVRADRDVWAAFLALIPLWKFRQHKRAEIVGAPVSAGAA